MDPNLCSITFRGVAILCSVFFNSWDGLGGGTEGNNAFQKRRSEQRGMSLVDGLALMIGGVTV
jgi:hypothetical protein